MELSEEFVKDKEEYLPLLEQAVADFTQKSKKVQKLTNLLVVLFVAFFACQSIATESPLYEPKDKELENKYKYEEFSAPPFPFMIERPIVCVKGQIC